MNKLLIFTVILHMATACNYIREKKVEFYCTHSNDSLLMKSFTFLQKNLTKEQWIQLNKQDAFLIKDIKNALESCKDSLVAGSIPMDIFLEYVLPLQIFNEPIENWREDCASTYAHLKKMPIGTICEKINWNFSDRFHYGDRTSPYPKPWSELKLMKKGDCYDMAQAPIYPLRALGIPATIDFTYGWGNANGAHAWNVVYINGKMTPFMGIEEGPATYSPFYVYDHFADPTRSGYRYPAKIYRKTPIINKEIVQLRTILEEGSTPNFLMDYKVKDVTAEYFPVSDISIVSSTEVLEPNQIAYLSIYNSNRWEPTSASIINSAKEICFSNLKRNMLYLPSLIKNQKVRPFDFPFILSDEGHIERLEPDTLIKQNLKVKFLQPILLDYLDGKANQSKLPVNAMIQIAYHDKYRKVSEEGQTYILYIWKKTGWYPQEKSIAEKEGILFNKIPTHALFLLSDHNGKFIGRPFTVKNETISWW